MRIYTVPERELFMPWGVFLSEEVGDSKVIVGSLKKSLGSVSFTVSNVP